MARRWQNQMVHKFHGKYSKTQTLSQSFQVWKMILNEKFSLNSSTVVYSQNEFSSIFRCALISSSKYSTHNFYYLYELFIFRFWNIRFVCEFLFEFIIWFHSAFNCQFTSWLHLFHFLWFPSPLAPLNVATASSLYLKTPCLFQVYRCSNCFAIWFFDFQSKSGT